MFYGWRRWIILGVFASAKAFLPGLFLPMSSTTTQKLRVGETTPRTIIMMQEASQAAPTASTSEAPSAKGVDVDDISGKRLLLEFSAFGFYNRTCQLELKPNGDCLFSKGMVTREKGAWRVEEEEGKEYLQFSAPLTELYTEIFEVPSSLLFWRVPLSRMGDGTIDMQGGQIISERKTLFGLKTNFIDEGSFKARAFASDEEFPNIDFDIREIDVPDGLKARKKKAKTVPSLAQDVAEPPLPSDLGSS